MVWVQVVQFTLLGASVVFSALVLISQKKSAIRESIRQMDDRNLSSANLKLKAILHRVQFCPHQTILSIRAGNIPAVSGISNPTNIDEVTVDIQREVEVIDGVSETQLRTISTKTGYSETVTVEEEHKELLVTCNSTDQGEVRRIADLALTKIRAGDQAT